MGRRLVNAAAIYFQHIKPFVLASQLDCCLPEKKHAPDFLFNIYEFIFLIIRKMKKRFSADFPAFPIFATNSRKKHQVHHPSKLDLYLPL